MKLSILTATYNREKYLKRLYESIINNQNYGLEAEWIIIDDGSIDRTKSLVEDFILENKLDIKYIYQKNSGKMSAINLGANMATGELLIDCDSDDFFSDNAFEIIYRNSDKLLSNNNLYGLCFLKQNINGEISGKKFEHNFMISTMFDLYFKKDIQGEKILVYNTKIRKKYKHILENREKFITEARMYHKMDENYKILCINEIVEIGDYLDDGYTRNYEINLKQNPMGYRKYYEEICKKGLKGMPIRKKLHILKAMLFIFIQKNRYSQ